MEHCCEGLKRKQKKEGPQMIYIPVFNLYNIKRVLLLLLQLYALPRAICIALLLLLDSFLLLPLLPLLLLDLGLLFSFHGAFISILFVPFLFLLLLNVRVSGVWGAARARTAIGPWGRGERGRPLAFRAGGRSCCLVGTVRGVGTFQRSAVFIIVIK